VVTDSSFAVYDTHMTWSEAVDTCRQNDGFIANTHPEVSLKLRNLLIKSTKQPYWIGKSLSPWVMLRGKRNNSTQTFDLSNGCTCIFINQQ
jgi:hypothetical protein